MADIATLDGVADANIASINGETDRGGTVNGVTWPSPVATITWTDSDSTGVDGTVKTFSSMALGTADASREIFVFVTGMNAGVDVSSMTVAGISATKIIADGGGVNAGVELWRASVPTGTTGDVVVTYDSSSARCGVSLYAGYDIATTATATDTSNADPGVGSINVPAGGVAIAAMTQVSGDPGGTTTWTGLTEDADFVVGGEPGSMSTASDDFASAQTPLAISANISNGSTFAFVCASFAAA
jgi:hypothetical protein